MANVTVVDRRTPSAERAFWAGLTARWSKAHRLVAVAVTIAIELWFLFVAAVAGSVGTIGWAGTAILVILAARTVWLYVQARRDRKVVKELQHRIKECETDVVKAMAVQRDLLPKFRHPGRRIAIAVPLIEIHASEGDLDTCKDLLPTLPADGRLLIGGCLTESASSRLPRVAMVEVARTWLRPFWPAQSVRALITLEGAQAVLHHRGRFQPSCDVGRQIWRIRREPFIAWNCACSLARAGKADDAVHWMARAVRGGFPADRLLTDPDLVSLREDTRATSLLNAASAAHSGTPATPPASE